MKQVDYSEFYYKTDKKPTQPTQKAISPNEITYVQKKQKKHTGRAKTIAILAIIFCFC